MQLQKVKAEIGEISSNPQGLLLEAIHSDGYFGALANPLMAPESAINRLNSSILEEFVAVRPTCFVFFIWLSCFLLSYYFIFDSLTCHNWFDPRIAGKLYGSQNGTCSIWCRT